MINKARFKIASVLSVLLGFFLGFFAHGRPAQSQQIEAAKESMDMVGKINTLREVESCPKAGSIRLSPRVAVHSFQGAPVIDKSSPLVSPFVDEQEQSNFISSSLSQGNCNAAVGDLIFFKLNSIMQRLDAIEKKLGTDQ